jgi:hypothetical protein
MTFVQRRERRVAHSGSLQTPGRLAMRIFSLVAILALAAPSLAQDDVTPQEVEDAIEKGIKALKAMQDRNGVYPGDVMLGGNTALATLALLSCDLPPEDPAIASGIAVLRELPPKDVYVVALQTMCFQLANPKKHFNLIQRNADWLMRARNQNGSWSYGLQPRGGFDNSNTQYAILGLHAAQEAGVKIPAEFWDRCRQHWVHYQANTGSWGYTGPASSRSMTVAGVSSLVIAQQHLPTVKAGTVEGKRIDCRGPREDKPLQKGIEWLGRNIASGGRLVGARNESHYFYYLYGLERAGRLTGRRFFANTDWYRRGAQYLVAQQQADGSWESNGLISRRLWDTAFALLFLSKGRIPILVNKLQFGDDEDWNNAPNNVRNLTRFVADVWKKPLNWQIVETRYAKTEDLLQAPILHLSGTEPPRFNDRELTILREFIEQGGTILGDANCSTAGFEAGFRELCQKLFPAPEQKLKPLDENHAVWTSLFELKPSWPLEGVNVGCRTAIFFSPEDLSCRWEFMFRDEVGSLPALRMGANVVAYATGPEQLQDKLEKRKVTRDFGENKVRRNFLEIAKIKHNGDWNIAPKAVRNLMGSLKDVVKVDVVGAQREISLEDPNLTNHPLIYMHGRTRFVLSDEEQRTLADFLTTNGVLFADACCASEAFDRAFRELMKKTFPASPLRPIPPDHELFTDRIGYDIRKLPVNFPAPGAVAAPALEGIEVDGRLVVIYSKYDVGCALEKQAGKDCKGYTHESALKLATNVVLYTLKE